MKPEMPGGKPHPEGVSQTFGHVKTYIFLTSKARHLDNSKAEGGREAYSTSVMGRIMQSHFVKYVDNAKGDNLPSPVGWRYRVAFLAQWLTRFVLEFLDWIAQLQLLIVAA